MFLELPHDARSSPGVSPPRGRLRGSVAILAVMFTATGFVGLLSEQVFEKLLGTLLGSSTHAAAAVLATYFVGLTLGALLYEGVLRRRVRNPIRLYGALEGGVAGLLVLTAFSFDLLIPLFAPLLSAARDHFAALQASRMFVAALWILPPTLLMGASLPAIADSTAVLRLPGRHRLLSMFYTLNLAGAIAAAVAGPYLVFPQVGLDGALAVCAVIGGAVSIGALRLARRHPLSTRREVEITAGDPSTPRARALIIGLAFASGFAFFALEVLWFHLLSAVIGSSVYAFATMLTVVLLGLGLGGAAAVVLAPAGTRVTWAFPGAVMAISGVAIAVTHGLWPTIPRSLSIAGAGVTSFGMAELLRFRHAIAVAAVPAACLGMFYPSLFRLASFPTKRMGEFVGKISAANAVGCAAGALSISFVLLPRFGSERLMVAIAVLLLIGGAILLGWWEPKRRPLAAGIAVLGLFFAGIPRWDPLRLTSGEHVYFRPLHVSESSVLRFFHEDSAGGITTVVSNPAGDGKGIVRTLLTNGKFQGNDGGERGAQIAFAVIPAMFVTNFDRALVIGAGTGATARVVGELGFREITVAEIAPGILAAARREFSHLNGGVLDQPNVRVEVEDGRNLLLLDDTTYDLITMEVTSVWFANSTNLYSREFYRLARSRLTRGGIMQQWIQMHHIDAYDIAATVATMRSVFRYVSFWSVGGQGIIVGSDDPQVVRAVALGHIRTATESLGWGGPDFGANMRALAVSHLLSPGAVDAMIRSLGDVVINTDRNRFLEYSTPRRNLDHGATQQAMEASLARYSDRSRPLIEREAGEMLSGR